MRKLSEALWFIAITLWVGGLWAIGYIAAPVLFSSLGDRQLAVNERGQWVFVIRIHAVRPRSDSRAGSSFLRIASRARKMSVFTFPREIRSFAAISS